MGTSIRTNDTLQLTKEQGFPVELDLNIHLKNSFKTEDFKEIIFTFKNKSDIRVYQQPPVRNFLVESKEGKWVYWGLVHVLEITHDYENKTTSGKFKIIHINTGEEMRMAHAIIDRNPNTDFFK